MKIKNPFSQLNKFEWILYLTSVVTIVVSYLVSGNSGLLEMITSLIGVTALIFVAKGLVIGQAMTVLFSVFYGIISLSFHYWGEMITYLFMSAPIALLATIEWIRHPYKNTAVVEVNKVTKKHIATMSVLAFATTVAFYFILASIKDISYLPMVLCFVMFLANDLYGFYNWRRLRKQQKR